MSLLHLPSELIDPLLACTIRLARPVRSTEVTTTVAPVLNVLPRNVLTQTNYAAILAMPWIDTGVGCRLGDFWLLDVLHARLTRSPYCRPLQYKLPDVLVTASVQGRVDVLEWWAEQGLPLVSHDREILQAASKGGHVAVLDFWHKAVGLDRMRYSLTDCVEQACKNAHLGVIDWWSTHATVSLKGSGNAAVAAGAAIESGHLDAVAWYLSESGVELEKEDEAALLIVAILTHQAAIVDLLVKDLGFSLTPISAAFSCLTGRVETLTQCLSLIQPSENGSTQIDGPVAYLLASVVGSTDLLHYLDKVLGLDDGFVLNQQDAFFKIARILLDLQSFSHLHKAIEMLFDWYDIDLIPANVASALGHVHVLDWLANHHGDNLQHGQCAVVSAAANGHLPMVQWWVQSLRDNIYRFPMSPQLINDACAHGHLAIVKYLWETSRATSIIRFEYSPAVAFPSLAQGGHVDLARWWIAHVGKPHESGVIERAVTRACKHGQRAFLEMMLNCDLLATVDAISEEAIGWAAKRGHLELLEWWAAQPSAKGQRRCRSWLDVQTWPVGFDVLEWMIASGLPMYDDRAARATTVTEWFVIQHGDPADGLMDVVHNAKTLYLNRCLDITLPGRQLVSFELGDASMTGQIAVLDWSLSVARRLGSELEYTWDSLVAATESKMYHVLDWWVNKSGLDLQVSSRGLGRAIGSDDAMMEWWVKTGLVTKDALMRDAQQQHQQQQEQDWGVQEWQ